MLEKQDFIKIKEEINEVLGGENFSKLRGVIKEEIGEALEAVVLPVLHGMKTDIHGMKAEMVTKSYLDDKLADLEGSVVVRQRKEDKKLNLLIDFLRQKNILEEKEIKMLKDFQVFPSLELN